MEITFGIFADVCADLQTCNMLSSNILRIRPYNINAIQTDLFKVEFVLIFVLIFRFASTLS